MVTTRKDIFKKDFEEAVFKKKQLIENLVTQSEKLYEIKTLLTNTLNSGYTIFLCGNGGSAADCQHFAAELTGRFEIDRRPLKAISLTTDTSALTAIANDFSFEEIFSRQLEALGEKGDCLIGISTSGMSPNVLKAVKLAKKNGIRTIGLLGRDGGIIAKSCDIAFVVNSCSTSSVQEAHIFIYHFLIRNLEKSLDQKL